MSDFIKEVILFKNKQKDPKIIRQELQFIRTYIWIGTLLLIIATVTLIN